jgi:hypothetical protein
MFLNRQGVWEASGERQITLPLGLKEELDAFTDQLYARWVELNAPLTIGQVLTILEELGWRHDNLASVNRCIRAWLLSTEQFRRVGEDYWIPAELLPPEIKRTRLQVLPIRVSAAEALQHLHEGGQSAEAMHGEQERKREQIILKGPPPDRRSSR